ncbi:MAG: ferredoxin--NADP reductase [Myxococcota bacterium]
MKLARTLSPRRLRLTTAQWRQDLGHLFKDASQSGPPVRIVNTPTPPPQRGLRLVVDSVREETSEARTIFLRSADPSRPLPQAEAGQFLTFELPIGGERLRRSYSLSTGPLDDGPRAITVKRVAGGRASTWLTTALAVGDVLEAIGPASGRFIYRPTPDDRRERTLVLIGAGSGITPLMAIARTALVAEPQTRVALLYGNRGVDDVIFRAALDALGAAYASRLRVCHVLERGAAAAGAVKGKLTAGVIAQQLPELLASFGDDARGRLKDVDAFYVCGPPAVMDNARGALLVAGVAKPRIHEERFQSLPPARESTEPATVLMRRGAVETPVVLSPGETLLEVAWRAGVPVGSSCTMGGCGACKVRVLEGELAMPDASCLTPAELEAGYALACIARCAGPATVEVPE